MGIAWGKLHGKWSSWASALILLDLVLVIDEPSTVLGSWRWEENGKKVEVIRVYLT